MLDNTCIQNIRIIISCQLNILFYFVTAPETINSLPEEEPFLQQTNESRETVHRQLSKSGTSSSSKDTKDRRSGDNSSSGRDKRDRHKDRRSSSGRHRHSSRRDDDEDDGGRRRHHSKDDDRRRSDSRDDGSRSGKDRKREGDDRKDRRRDSDSRRHKDDDKKDDHRSGSSRDKRRDSDDRRDSKRHRRRDSDRRSKHDEVSTSEDVVSGNNNLDLSAILEERDAEPSSTVGCVPWLLRPASYSSFALLLIPC